MVWYNVGVLFRFAIWAWSQEIFVIGYRKNSNGSPRLLLAQMTFTPAYIPGYGTRGPAPVSTSDLLVNKLCGLLST